MKTLILVSLCESVKSFKNENGYKEYIYEFHFRGAYAGVEIKKVVINSTSPIGFVVGGEYLLHVEVFSCSQGEIQGRALKSRSFKSLKWN